MPLKLLIIIRFYPATDLILNNHDILNKLKLYAQLIRLEKPIGIYLLLWPTLWALTIAAQGTPDGWITFVFLMGVFLMRSAGCAINDFADRNIDKHVKRTADRPLTSGKISSKEALMVFFVLIAIAFVLVLSLNRLTIYLAIVAALLAASYPFMKRYHYLPQMHLGAAFAMAVPMAFAAITGSVPKVAWLLYIATLLWTTAYDTMYGMVDRDDDVKIGVKSTAILFGEYDRHIIVFIQLLFLFTLVLVGMELHYNAWFYVALAAVGLHFAYQLMLIFYRLPEYCFQAFLSNHWVGLIVFVGVLIQYV